MLEPVLGLDSIPVRQRFTSEGDIALVVCVRISGGTNVARSTVDKNMPSRLVPSR
jgi:hypothetical protein